MQKHLILIHFAVQRTDTEQQQQIKKFSRKDGKEFPYAGDDIGQNLQILKTIQRVRKNPFQQRNLFQRKDHAVGPVRIFQPKCDLKCLIHDHPPAAPR